MLRTHKDLLARSRARLRRTARSDRGVTTVVLVLVLAFFVVVPLGFLGFEMCRLFLMQQQLQAVTDAAALSGTAAMASAPSGYTVSETQTLAMSCAVGTFEQNSVLNTLFNSTNVNASLDGAPLAGPPPAHTAIVNISLLDNSGNLQSVGSTTATTIRLRTMYSDLPIFASSLLPIAGLETVSAVSDGGLPQLDLVLCFDESGSMDDNTTVSLVTRYWNAGPAYVDYSTTATGTLYNLLQPPPDGVALNAVPPQNLSYSSAATNTNPYTFTEAPPNSMTGLRANGFTYPAGSLPAPLTAATQYPPGALIPEQGAPPGNFDPTNKTNLNGNGINPFGIPNSFTDIVVQVPTTGSFTFPNIATCVEASRGNLESSAMLLQSQGGGTINPTLPAPQAGYYTAYWNAVRAMADPISNARAAATNFFSTMNTSSNAHFGLETFADTAGSSPTGVWTGTNMNIDAAYTKGGTNAFPLPLISLSSSQNNYSAINSAINGSGTTLPIGPTGMTDISDALHEAITELTDPTKFRPGAKKAIILFTDGVPNLPGGQAAASSAALSQASAAATAGIPIFTIGLSQNPAIKPAEDALLGDGQNGSGNGIAYTSGNGAMYISVTNSSQLDSAFQQIARSLVVLQ